MLTDFPAQTVTLGSNLLVKAQTIPQNDKPALFVLLKVPLTKDIQILKMAKVFEKCFFFAKLKYVIIPKTLKNVPKKFIHTK